MRVLHGWFLDLLLVAGPVFGLVLAAASSFLDLVLACRARFCTSGAHFWTSFWPPFLRLVLAFGKSFFSIGSFLDMVLEGFGFVPFLSFFPSFSLRRSRPLGWALLFSSPLGSTGSSGLRSLLGVKSGTAGSVARWGALTRLGFRSGLRSQWCRATLR